MEILAVKNLSFSYPALENLATGVKSSDRKQTDTKPENMKLFDRKPANMKPGDTNSADGKPENPESTDTKAVDRKKDDVKPGDMNPEELKPCTENRPFELQDISFSVEKGDFVCVCGKTGSGKSTLLRMLKNELRPNGKLTGDIEFEGKSLFSLSERESASKIGFVLQNPEQQIVTDRVWHELAFGPESLGWSTEKIRTKTAEVASRFGLEKIFMKDTLELSGGQKQLLNLASVMVMEPDILILDEPTAQLDPIAASEFISMLSRLNRETGLTVIISEHRTEEVLPLSDKLLLIDEGKITGFGDVDTVINGMQKKDGLLCGMPSAVRLYKSLDVDLPVCPKSIRDGRNYITENFGNRISVFSEEEFSRKGIEKTAENAAGKAAEKATGNTAGKAAYGIAENFAEKVVCCAEEKAVEKAAGRAAGKAAYGVAEKASGKPVLEYKNVFFRYGREQEDVLSGMNLSVYEKEILCVLGGNGSGKTTAVMAAAGVLKPYSGSIRVFERKLKEYKGNELYSGTLAVLPQDVRTVFRKNTVAEELKAAGINLSEGVSGAVGIVLETLLEKNAILQRHPYDLSGGQQQLLGLAEVLASDPKILLLDEPAKGLDASAKIELTGVLKNLRDAGMTIVCVTHDAEFSALCADRCALFFRGDVIAVSDVRSFFEGTGFYSTAAQKMSKGYYENVLTVPELVEMCRKNM